MIRQCQSLTFDRRIRHSILTADWHRIVGLLTADDLLKFSDNPLFRINAIAEEFGCALSSVRWESSLKFRFVKRYGRNKVMWNVLVDRELFTDVSGMEALLCATLPGQVAMANDKNTIRQYFGPAASR